jgi:cytochrome c2
MQERKIFSNTRRATRHEFYASYCLILFRILYMNSEIKYILRGWLYVVVLLAGFGIIIYCFSYKNNIADPVTRQAIDYNKLMNDPNVAKGKNLFQANCATCHPLNKTADVPSLAGVEERILDKDVLYAWIRNSDEILRSGNPYFRALSEEYNKTKMPAFPKLSDKDIDQILVYIRVETMQGFGTNR